MNPSDEGSNRDSDVLRDDRLLHRALERVASADEWEEIESLAARDPEVYRRLARYLRDDAVLAAHVGESIAVVESIEIPPSTAHTNVTFASGSHHVHRAGWLAAAAMFLLWLTTALQLATVESPGTSFADHIPFNAPRPSALPQSPSSLVRVSLDGTTSASELSRTLVDAQRAGQGWELLYLCRSFERVRVSDLDAANFGDVILDDSGAPRIVPVALSDPSDWREF